MAQQLIAMAVARIAGHVQPQLDRWQQERHAWRSIQSASSARKPFSKFQSGKLLDLNILRLTPHAIPRQGPSHYIHQY